MCGLGDEEGWGMAKGVTEKMVEKMVEVWRKECR